MSQNISHSLTCGKEYYFILIWLKCKENYRRWKIRFTQQLHDIPFPLIQNECKKLQYVSFSLNHKLPSLNIFMETPALNHWQNGCMRRTITQMAWLLNSMFRIGFLADDLNEFGISCKPSKMNERQTWGAAYALQPLLGFYPGQIRRASYWSPMQIHAESWKWTAKHWLLNEGSDCLSVQAHLLWNHGQTTGCWGFSSFLTTLLASQNCFTKSCRVNFLFS